MNPSRLALPRLVLLVALSSVLTACGLDLGVRLEVGPDGGGTVAVALTADRAAQERAAAAGADPLSIVVAAGEQLRDDGWGVRDRSTDDGAREVELVRRVDDPAELSSVTAGLADALAAPEARPLEPFTVTVTDDRIQVTGTAAFQPLATEESFGLAPDAALAALTEGEALEYTVTVVLPGEVVSSNATRTDDRTLVWEVPAGERVELQAEGVRPHFPLVPVLLGVLAALVVTAAALAVREVRARRRPVRRSRPRARL